MGMKLINESSLTAIGNAIRAKNGSNDTYTPAEMATAIGNISGGGQTIEVIPADLLQITGDFTDGFQGFYGKEMFSKIFFQITTTDLRDIGSAFKYKQISGAHDDGIHDWRDWRSLILNFEDQTGSRTFDGFISAKEAFRGCTYLWYLPIFNFTNTGLYNGNSMFLGCNNLLSVDQLMNDGIFLDTIQSDYGSMFVDCQKLKHIPHLEKLKSLGSTHSCHIYYCGFQNCNCLEEVLNLPVDTISGSNVALYCQYLFDNFCKNTYMVSRITFATNNGVPYTANWSKANINLAANPVGYHAGGFNTYTDYPNVETQADYDLYKNDIYEAKALEFSRYNHTSAVETINTLPDCSATAGTSGNNMNTIRFKGNSGSGTDGGAISNLTNEEIAVATAKGWNVVIV